MPRSTVETLEPRQLFAATFPDVLGEYSGLITFSGGATDSETLTILTQKKAAFTGTAFLGSGVSAKVHGTVTKTGVVHATLTANKFSSKVIGAVSGDSLAGAFTTKQGKVKSTGVISLTKTPA